MSSIRDLIKEIAVRLREPDNLHSEEAARLLVELSSLLSSVNVEIVQSEFAFNKKKKELLDEAESVSAAEVVARATDEWLAWKERVAFGASCEEMIRSLKYLCRNLDEERRIIPNN